MSSAEASAAGTVDGPSRRWPRSPPRRLLRLAAVAAASFVAYLAAHLLSGPASTLCSVIGVGACGWAWLFARALFDPAERDARWAYVVALVVASSGALSVLVPAAGVTARLAGNIYALSGSAALLLTFVEPFHRYTADLPTAEKRFRFAFLAVFGALVAASVLGLVAETDGPDQTLRDNATKSVCALLGLAGLPAAVWFRWRHAQTSPSARPTRRAPSAEDRRLAERLQRLLLDEAIELEPDLRVAEVAAKLREPEYRVSQCITSVLGFPNFNRWINHHRIARAKRLLGQPDERRSILEIAFACGFASLGPFNRAFRHEVGTTPRDYRMERRTDGQGKRPPPFPERH